MLSYKDWSIAALRVGYGSCQGKAFGRRCDPRWPVFGHLSRFLVFFFSRTDSFYYLFGVVFD